MTSNGYLNPAVQTAIVDGVSKCTEHHIKPLTVIKEARCIVGVNLWLSTSWNLQIPSGECITASSEFGTIPCPCLHGRSSVHMYQVMLGCPLSHSSSRFGISQGDPLSVSYRTVHRKHDGNFVCHFSLFTLIYLLSIDILMTYTSI